MNYYNPYLFYYQQYLYNMQLAHHLMYQNTNNNYPDRIPYNEVNNDDTYDSHENSTTWKVKPGDIVDLGLEGVLIKGDSSKFFKDIFIEVNESILDGVKCRVKINTSGEAELICDVGF